MVITILLFGLGLVIMCVAGDKFVDAAVDIAEKIGVPPLVIGATIVSIGTTLPEVLVSTTAAINGLTDICTGNAFGSIICNTALIAAIGQLFSPAKAVNVKSIGWRALMFAAVWVFLAANLIFSGQLSRLTGVILLLTFVVYAVISIKRSSMERDSRQDSSANRSRRDINLLKSVVTMAITAALLFIGANLLVDNGQTIAFALKVPDRVVAVTVIALGTSLPELVTTITSLIKGQGAVGLGNIIGANLLNLLVVIGIPASIRGINTDVTSLLFDMSVGLAAMALLLIPMMIEKRGRRWQAVALLIGYGAYCATLF